MANEVEVEPLTIKELISASDRVVTREIEIELGDGEKVIRRVKFKPLTFGQATILEEIPREENRRYTKTVVKLCSIEPAVDNMDDLDKVPSGFLRHYSNLILRESGKTPFLD